MKIKVTISVVYLVVVWSIHAQDESKTASIDNRFWNWRNIRTSIKRAENIDEASLLWGKNTLAALNLEKLDANEKALVVGLSLLGKVGATGFGLWLACMSQAWNYR